MTPTIGIDIGGTSVRAAVIDSSGNILASLRDLTPHTDRDTDANPHAHTN